MIKYHVLQLKNDVNVYSNDDIWYITIIKILSYMLLDFKYTMPKQTKSSLFFDFDNRKDHLEKVQYYVDRVGAYKFIITRQKISIHSLLSIPFLFMELVRNIGLIFALSKITGVSIIKVTLIVIKFIKFYNLGVRIGKSADAKFAISLNFQTAIGFPQGLKAASSKWKIITIQHGILSPLTSKPSWKDKFSDAYVCWNDTFASYVSPRLAKNCIVIRDGVYDFVKYSDSEEEDCSHISVAVFFSSYSSYTSEEDIICEINIANQLSDYLLELGVSLIVRLHPSIKGMRDIRVGRELYNSQILLSLSTVASLQSLVSKEKLFFTVSSTAILEPLNKNKKCIVIAGMRENILNSSFKSFNFESHDLAELINCYSLNRSDAKYIYGDITNCLEQYIEECDIHESSI